MTETFILDAVRTPFGRFAGGLSQVQAAESSAEVPTEAAAAEALTNADCFECHTDPTLTRTVQGRSVALRPLVQETFEASVHGALNCVDCHTAITELVHEGPLPPAQCADGRRDCLR